MDVVIFGEKEKRFSSYRRRCHFQKVSDILFSVSAVSAGSEASQTENSKEFTLGFAFKGTPERPLDFRERWVKVKTKTYLHKPQFRLKELLG